MREAEKYILVETPMMGRFRGDGEDEDILLYFGSFGYEMVMVMVLLSNDRYGLGSGCV